MNNVDIIPNIKEIIDTKIDIILSDIATNYKLNYNELKEKYTIVEKPQSFPDPPKKRGRKPKKTEEYIETEEYEYNGKTYLVDNKNIVYTNNMESSAVIGEKLVDGTIKFYKS